MEQEFRGSIGVGIEWLEQKHHACLLLNAAAKIMSFKMAVIHLNCSFARTIGSSMVIPPSCPT
jgi:hypothetical protein